MRPRCLTLLPWIAALLAAAAAGGERPSGAHRLVRLFDFEERAQTTEPVPVHWVRLVHQPGRIERPGFPPWNESGFSEDRPFRGNWSVRLPTRGGSAALRLAGGVVPVVPQADYIVAAAVRTEGLSRARARIVARFLDNELRPISGSRQESPLLITGGEWERVSVELWGDHPEAAWVQVDLLLLQPDTQPAGAPDDDGAIVRDDLDGAAWFDDLAIMQIPRLELTTNSPTNVIVAPETPTLRISVRDLTGEQLSGTLRVTDLDGNTVAERRLVFFASTPNVEWTPELHEYGWRRVSLEVEAKGERVGSTTLDFIWAPPGAPDPTESKRLTLTCEDEPHEMLPAIPDLLAATGVGGVQIAIPTDPSPEAFLHLEEAVMSALERRFDVALQIARLADRVAQRLHIASDDVLAFPLDPESELWQSYLEPPLARFGQRVSRWQIGATGDDHSLVRDLPERRDAFRAAFERLSPEPIVASPWSPYEGLPASTSLDALAFELPPQVAPSGGADLARSWRATAPRADLTLLIAPYADADPHTLVRQLAIRTLHTWGAPVDRLAFRPPWTWSGERRPSPRPRPELGAIRSLATHLHGRSVAGRLPMPAGAHALILAGPRGDALALWNEYADPNEAVLHAYLGEGPIRAFDLFGNELPVEQSGGRHRLRLGPDPVFVEGVNTELLLFQSAAEIEPSFIVSAGARRELELVLTNPWDENVSGRVRLTGPEHWRLAPSVQPLTMGPGQTIRVPFEISLGIAEEAGAHTVTVEAELNIARETTRLTIEPTIDIGIADLALEGGVRLHNTTDVIVVAIVTNLGDEPVTLTIASLAPGHARQQAPVSTLPPGESAVRQFRYPGAASELAGQSVRLSVIEAEGAERLNRTLSVPE